MPSADALARLRRGTVIPAHPLALTARRRLDERRQRALTRYYRAAGAGGVAVGVHTTQFAIREKGLLQPVLELAAAESGGMLRIAGICGPTRQAAKEAALARDLGYDVGLLSLAALRDASDAALVAHARAVAKTIPLFGFYLQPSVGGRVLSYEFWRRFAEIPNVVAIKMAPFNRYQTIDVVRAVAAAGRAGEIALYTGNDDNIVLDLLTEYRVGGVSQRIVGGLLGHWAVWTRRAVELLEEIKALPGPAPRELLARAVEITDSNAAFFDAANGFAGCIAGLHEVLRRQGLLEGLWCLDPEEGLSPGQKAEIDRVYGAYPRLNDDAFVAEHRDDWLK
jgi:dihydrodipicolinate synthase/N-acetylneuraminate lyase